MATILIIAHTPRGTGFGKIAIGIANALSLQHEVNLIGVGHARASNLWQGIEADQDDIGCTTALRNWLRSNNTDILLLVGVNTLIAWQAERVRKDGFTGILIAYVPVEGPIYNSDRLQGLRSCTEVVAYHATAAEDLTNVLGKSCIVSWIYHGIHKNPVAIISRPALRKKLLSVAENHLDRVWMLNANRNDDRKCPELTLRAFAEIVPKFPNTTLVMHCNPNRPGVNLRVERDRLRLQDNVIFTKDIFSGSWSDEQIGDLYSCCEIGINSALGEGWGLIPFEHALRGGAQILPAHAGLLEIWEEIPKWVPVRKPKALDAVSLGQIPDSDALASAMLIFLQDPVVRSQNAVACGIHASKKRFNWNTINKQWQALILKLLKENKKSL